MHELGITQQIVEVALDHAGGAQVVGVVVEIGKLSAILPDAVRFCFELCCEGTALEGATLTILETAGRGKCRACGAEMELDGPLGRCSCGSGELDWIAGEELRIRSIEISASASPAPPGPMPSPPAGDAPFVVKAEEIRR